MASRKQIKKTQVGDVLFTNMRTIIESDGNLIPIESNYDTPFPIKRVFYVYGVRDEDIRGCHAHHTTKQLLICLNGKVEVICKDGISKKSFLLESPQQGLLIPELIWDEQIYRSEDSVLLVLSSTKYTPSDYIHDFNEFKSLKGIKNDKM